MRRADSRWWSAGFTKPWWDGLSAVDREAFLDTLTDDELEDFYCDWRVWARDKQLVPEGVWSTWMILAGRGFGKSLDVETPVATPAGWTTMGALRAGDEVFDETGAPCRVTIAHDIRYARPCFAVRFSDGETIVADEEHLWLTSDKAARKAAGRAGSGRREFPAVRSTAEIRDSLMAGREVNHSIDTSGPLKLAHAALPIDPYVLGAWLGDGSSACGEITTADEEVLLHIAAAGEPVGLRRAAGGRAQTISIGAAPPQRDVMGRMTTNGSLHSRLKALGVLRNKHVPTIYLRASEAQRAALLQGLMDTDGHCTPGGHVEFCSTTECSSRAVHELAVSLGMKAVTAESRATLDGQDCGPRWRVTWTPYRPVFRIERKLARQHLPGAQAARQARRYIVAVDPVETRPVRCITVDSPSALYLVGRNMVPTHNTRTGVETVRDAVRRGVSRICLLGQGDDDIREVMVEGQSGIMACSPKSERPIFRPSVGGGRLIWPNGAMAYTYSAMDPESLRGPQFELAWADEPMAYPPEHRKKAISNLKFGLRLGKRPRLIMTTTPKPHRWLTEELAKAKKAEFDRAGVPIPLELRRYIVTRGSLYENRENLPEAFVDGIIDDYEGTNLGRQEIYAEILGTEEGALWTDEMLDRCRLPAPSSGPERLEYLQAFARTCSKIVVSIDPNLKSNSKTAHEAGIAVCGQRGKQRYVLEDRSTKGGPAKWAAAAIKAGEDFDADEYVAETNQGGDMVAMTLRGAAERDISVRQVHATRGKMRRAEPIAAAYERAEVHHLGDVGSTERPGPFFRLESQMTSLHDGVDPTGEDFDRCDAVVWGLTRLGLKKSAGSRGSSGVGIRTFEDFGVAVAQ